jgi:hypothetical protein
MGILKGMLNIIMVLAGALLGNWVGERWRAQDTGGAGHELSFIQRGEGDEITIAINPVLSNFLPAVIIGILSRPFGWIVSFVAGTLIARFIGDRYEEPMFELINNLIPGSAPDVEINLE